MSADTRKIDRACIEEGNPDSGPNKHRGESEKVEELNRLL